MTDHRHTLALPGQLEGGSGRPCPIIVSRLSALDCKLQCEVHQLASGECLQLWLGAVGPLRGRL